MSARSDVQSLIRDPDIDAVEIKITVIADQEELVRETVREDDLEPVRRRVFFFDTTKLELLGGDEDVREPLWLTGEGMAARDELPLALEARMQGRQDGAVQLRQAVRYREAASLKMQRRPCPRWQVPVKVPNSPQLMVKVTVFLFSPGRGTCRSRHDRGGEQGSR